VGTCFGETGGRRGWITSEDNAPCTERDILSRVLIITADSQHEASQSGVRHVLHVNYLPPEQMPSHQRDFPREQQRVEMAGLEGSRLLGLLVACYLTAIFAAIGLIGVFVDGSPNIASASVGATKER